MSEADGAQGGRRIPAAFELPLEGPGREPVDFRRTVDSHGLASLPPFRLEPEVPALEVTLALPRVRSRTIRVRPGRPGFASVTVIGTPPSRATQAAAEQVVRHVLALDVDLSPFYAVATRDPALSWVARGAGRMLRAPTVFEDIAKTICTTNCAWSATERMVGALVEHLGERAAGAPPSGAHRRAFPSPAAMAEVDDDFYTETARAGYRGRYLRELARGAADGSVDLESLRDPELSDEEVERRLLALPGVGPYAAAHVMTMSLGRYRKLILDAWTRPKYASLNGGRPVADSTIVRRFRRYGPYAGLAFWLTVTADWA